MSIKFSGSRSKLLAVVGVLFIASFSAGKKYGDIKSPDWNDPTASVAYIAKNLQVQFPDQDHVVIQSSCSPTRFTYSSALDTLLIDLQDLQTLNKLDLPQRGGISEIEELLYSIVGIPITLSAAGAMTYQFSSQVSAPDKMIVAALSVVAIGSGFGVGYMLGYDAQPDCEAEIVKSTFTDISVWQKLANSAIDARNNKGIPMEIQRLLLNKRS